MSNILLEPQGKFVPDLSHAKSPVVATGRQFKHNKGPDLRDVLGLFDDGDLRAHFRVNHTECTRPCPTGRINWVIRWSDYAQGQDGVQLYPWNGAPIELDSRARGVCLHRRAVRTAEDVELVVVQVHRHRIVSLIRRALCPQP